MKYAIGDLFSYSQTHAICIPTNISWGRSGENIMGAGVALQAKKKWPQLPLEVGMYYKRYKHDSGVFGLRMFAPTDALLFLVPTKPLLSPYNLSWKQPSDLTLIKKSSQQLVTLLDSGYPDIHSVALPRLGCGYGELAWEDVHHVLEETLDDRFTLVSLV